MKADEEIRLRCLDLALQISSKAEQTMEISKFLYNFVKTGKWGASKKYKPTHTQK